MTDCPTCGRTSTDGNFCVRCGAPLQRSLAHARHRSEYAAGSGEHRYAPWLVSTLFPHLPKHSERDFHAALAAGAAVVAILGALRLFPVALITAALLLPVLVVLYFYDVDIYEGEPRWAWALTIVWGAAGGVVVGLLANGLAPTGAASIDRGSTAHVLTGGLVIPLVGVVVTLAGPLLLLRFQRFNELLDGATFGAATAASFAAAQVIVVGSGVVNGGIRPQAAVEPWVARLLAVAIATPVLSMSAIGAATAAIWLRYRAPLEDRGALGVPGRAPVAVALAAVLIVAGAIGETFLPAGAWLIWLAALDLVGLVLLRRSLHLGLLEEASEIEIGPPVSCTGCGAETATHTFCSNCGVALKASPKVRRGRSPDAPGSDARGGFGGRLGVAAPGRTRGHRRFLAHGAVMTVIAGVAVAIAELAAPSSPKPRCEASRPCGRPPIVSRAVIAFPGYTAWRSSDLGYELRYPSGDWSISHQDGSDVVLQTGNGSGLMIVSGIRSSQATAAGLLQTQVGSLQAELLGLTPDTRQADQLLGTAIGQSPGPGRVYSASISSPQSPQSPVTVAVMAAAASGITVAVTVVAPGDDAGQRSAVYQSADDIIESIQWPAA